MMSYKIYLYEKACGCGMMVTSKTDGVALLERLKMFDRDMIEQNRAMNKKTKNFGKGTKNPKPRSRPTIG